MPAAHDSTTNAPGSGAHRFPQEHPGADGDGADHRPPTLAGRRREQAIAKLRGKRAAAGWIAMVLIAIAVLTPTHFVVQYAGPALNTIGSVDGTKLLDITGKKTYPTTGALDMTTIYSPGGGQQRVPFFTVLWGWLNPQEDVVPEELVVPRGITSTEKSEQNTLMMEGSQQVSVAAALQALKIPFQRHLGVAGFATELNSGALRVSDRLETINGTPIADLEGLKAQLNKAGAEPSTLGILRGGKPLKVQVQTSAAEDGQRQLGILIAGNYEFPLEARFGLENVGGSSAGMMFALAVIDQLTEGSMTGGKHFAGTGTITVEGEVGPIGGIAQKLVGARENGAEYFLAPEANCPDVIGRIPAGLQVIKVATLEEARAAVEGIGAGRDAASFPGCG